ncbi:glutaredoxin family protein [Methanosalsum natronophilum]|uniref:glutaredoxin family protein n=1 Tax=Methanosalsum natronophilum TaxID=768733 RepID=UPI00216A4C49|nr:glutaredoxin family protein [Methanosalsum natronophilum]MCS3924537.1 glutaredoxin [Methanosalsum natronophilum]
MAKIVMYTLSTCPWCKKAKTFFEENDITFESIDYDLEDKESQKEIITKMKELGGTTATPFVIIDDIVIVGYRPKEYAKALNLGDGSE